MKVSFLWSFFIDIPGISLLILGFIISSTLWVQNAYFLYEELFLNYDSFFDSRFDWIGPHYLLGSLFVSMWCFVFCVRISLKINRMLDSIMDRIPVHFKIQ